MTNRKTVLRALALLAMCALSTRALTQERMEIDADGVKRRTCPSVECGVIGQFFAGESVPVYESSLGWSRVSGYYSAACHDGHSAFVESGRSDCTDANGIVRGEMAEWIKSDFLAEPGADG